jgi:hypothetical protein
MFSKPNAIVYLRRNHFIVAGKHIPPARLNFSRELVDDLEVRRPDKFIAGCHEFFVAHKLHNRRVLVVLDQSVVFTKTVPLDKAGNPAAIAQAFIAAMPFAAGKRACVQLREADQLRLFATNADLYGAIIEALRLAGTNKHIVVTPAPAYDLAGDEQLGTAIERFISDASVRAKLNFSDITAL